MISQTYLQGKYEAEAYVCVGRLSIPRSRRWAVVRNAHLKKERWCRMCGSTIDLEVHHMKPFHLFPELELDDSNLITLCETEKVECHLKWGHLGNWKTFNEHIAELANSPNPHVGANDYKPLLVGVSDEPPSNISWVSKTGIWHIPKIFRDLFSSFWKWFFDNSLYYKGLDSF